MKINIIYRWIYEAQTGPNTMQFERGEIAIAPRPGETIEDLITRAHASPGEVIEIRVCMEERK